jgi:hypothetical protein
MWENQKPRYVDNMIIWIISTNSLNWQRASGNYHNCFTVKNGQEGRGEE